MSENNRYFYGYENKQYPKKDDKYYDMNENKHHPEKCDHCCDMKEDKQYPKKDDHYCDMKEDKQYPKKDDHYCDMKENKHCPEKKDNCCCKLSIRRALEILSSDRLEDAINFNRAAFITDFFIAGSDLEDMGSYRHDNLENRLDGSLDKLDPCECDLLEISGKIFYPVEDNQHDEPDDLNAKFVSLCSLKAIAFNVNGESCQAQNRNFDLIKDALRRFKCDEKDCKPTKCDDCCCGKGIVKEIMAGKISGRVGLTAGSLALRRVDILGCIGNVLILGNKCKDVSGSVNDIDAKIFLVCSEAVQFIF